MQYEAIHRKILNDFFFGNFNCSRYFQYNMLNKNKKMWQKNAR